MYPVLSSCGGGGGTSASAPPSLSLNQPEIQSLLNGNAAGVLFQDIPGEGPRWLGLVDGDSGYIPLRGNSVGTEDTLTKLPTLTSIDGITTEFSKISYMQNQLNNIQDPGRYILWGKRSNLIPPDSISFTLKGQWTCTYCATETYLRRGALTGQLLLNPIDDVVEVTLNGDGLQVRADLERDKNNQLSSRLMPKELQLDGITLTPIRSDILGAVFGPEAQEAGLIFGIADDQGRVFTGGATGTKQ